MYLKNSIIIFVLISIHGYDMTFLPLDVNATRLRLKPKHEQGNRIHSIFHPPEG